VAADIVLNSAIGKVGFVKIKSHDDNVIEHNDSNTIKYVNGCLVEVIMLLCFPYTTMISTDS